MNRYQKAIKYTKPSTNIDEKIDRLNEMMTTTGMYTVVNTDGGVEEQPPEFNPPPLGDLGPDDFQWPDQGDGSDPDNLLNLDGLSVTDTLGKELPLYDYLPGVNYDGWKKEPDYSLYGGKKPYAIVYDGRALASTRLFYLSDDGLNLVMQIGAYTTPGPYTDLQKEFSDWYYNADKSNLTTKTIYIWGPLQFLVGGYYGAGQYYPADRSTTTDPKADRALYAYTMYVPGTGNRNYASDPGVRVKPPSVTNVVSRNDLGDSNYYSGPVSNVLNLIQGVVNFGQGVIDFISGFGSGGNNPLPPPLPPPNNPPPPPPPEDSPPPPPPPEDTPPPPPPPPEDENDDRPLVALGYDENGKPTGFTRLSPIQMEQFKDGGGDAAIREGKSLNEVMQDGYENRKNAVTDFTSGIGDGLSVLGQVQDTLNVNKALGNIEPPSSPGERSTIKEGEKGSSTNPVQTNLSDSSMNELQNAMNNYDSTVDGDLKSYLNRVTSSGDNLGLKGTHNNIQDVEVRGDDVVIKDTYGFGPSEDIYNKPVVKQVSDTAEVIYDALGLDGKEASENVQTFFDQLGPVGAAAGAVSSGGQSIQLPGKTDPVVHFETVIPGGAQNLNNSKSVKEETLFEKWKKKDQKKSKPDQLKLIYNYFYYLPKTVKKMVIMDLKVELEIMMLPPDEKSFREKELRNSLINKHHEIYMDEKFPENVEQTSRVKKILARNIELSDPKTFKDPKPALTYGKLVKPGTAKKYAKRNVVKKKSNNLYTKTLAHTDMNRVKELREEKIKQEKIAEVQKQQEEILAELKLIEIKESPKYSNWRRDLSEAMTTAGMGMVNYAPTGDVDIVTTDQVFATSFNGNNESVSGGVVILAGTENSIYGGTHTIYRRAMFRVDGSKSSTLKLTISKGGGTSSWTDRDPAESFNDAVKVNVYQASGPPGGPSYYNANLSSGTHLIPLPGQFEDLQIQIEQFAKVSETGSLRITGASLQRRTPVNVFVSLDDPEANTFIRGGLGGDKERREKLKDMLEAGNEWMAYNGLEPSKTTPGDIALDTIPYEPPSPGPGGYKPPGSYDPNQFYNLDNTTPMPSPNLPQTGPGQSSIPDGTKVAASYPKMDPLDKLLKDIDDADKKLKKQGPGTRPGKGRGMGDTWEGPGKIV